MSESLNKTCRSFMPSRSQTSTWATVKWHELAGLRRDGELAELLLKCGPQMIGRGE